MSSRDTHDGAPQPHRSTAGRGRRAVRVADDPPATPAEPDVRPPLRRVTALFRRHRRWVAALVLAACLLGAVNVVSPFLLRAIIDRALPDKNAALISYLAGGMIVAALAGAGLGVVTTWLANLIGQRVMHELRVEVFTHLQRMSLLYYVRTRPGELQSRIANDVGGVENVVANTAASAVQNATSAAAVGVAALVMSWKLALICLAVVPLFLLAAIRLGGQRRGIARRRQGQLANLTAMVEEGLSVAGMLLSTTMGRRAALAQRFTTESRALADSEMRAAMSGKWLLSTRRASLTMVPAVVYWVAGLAFAHGAVVISIGTAVAFTSMLNRLVGPASALQGLGLQVSTSMALFGRIFEVLDEPVDIVEKPTARALPAPTGDVRFDGVGFRYADDQPWTLDSIDLHVPAGTTTALVGETGSGKTTVGYLVSRLVDPGRGAVLIDGIDLRDLRLDAVSGAVGLVSQDTYLFHDTVRANLLFGRPDATQDQIEAACRAARIHDLVASLPDGYDTVVGARGHRFSGGERQRLAIARMILRDPPVLVLDEATSALDNETERAVQAALDELSRGRTTIAIAHRLSTVRHADQIVVLDRGRIVERGTHSDLITLGGRYARLATGADPGVWGAGPGETRADEAAADPPRTGVRSRPDQ
ncbi:multidrug ABC transporter ATP-binding protein [Asanoa ishikariensis]|uniref:ATP-binding cassette, subfamily B n=1 Tax=Asanoa ishikariensis TaxID=137265 RepID=A0A1H3S271_9ACTN|nr:ABC transporter ATP-binding protein [Asanoa ishikariensis]GIF66578.1 multidrug ABC transporter ATP-binding protein [Asanoa ishikariensis]SDZ31960.1 ATP-binding cassette, subfamily B [Asanoa ishikariensis]